MIKIGAHALANAVLVAPMAGITDRPFRLLARRFGAALAVSEMVSARPELRASRKTRLRLDHAGEPGPISVQIAGSDPAQLAEAARCNVELGAEIIDINMGCPAKKVCNAYAGSALLADVVEAQPGLARGAQLGPRTDHLRHGERRAEASREAPERSIRDARHRSDEHCVGKRVGADLDHETLTCRLACGGKRILERFTAPRKVRRSCAAQRSGAARAARRAS